MVYTLENNETLVGSCSSCDDCKSYNLQQLKARKAASQNAILIEQAAIAKIDSLLAQAVALGWEDPDEQDQQP